MSGEEPKGKGKGKEKAGRERFPLLYSTNLLSGIPMRGPEEGELQYQLRRIKEGLLPNMGSDGAPLHRSDKILYPMLLDKALTEEEEKTLVPQILLDGVMRQTMPAFSPPEGQTQEGDAHEERVATRRVVEYLSRNKIEFERDEHYCLLFSVAGTDLKKISKGELKAMCNELVSGIIWEHNHSDQVLLNQLRHHQYRLASVPHVVPRLPGGPLC